MATRWKIPKHSITMFSMRVAIGSSVLAGLINPLDHWHDQALALHDALIAIKAEMVFFDCVTTETVSAVSRRLQEKKCLDEIDRMLDRLDVRVPLNRLSWILPDVPRLYGQALGMIRSSSGALNFNDALIALACRERGIPAIASFDGDFDQVDWLQRLAAPEDISASTS